MWFSVLILTLVAAIGFVGAAAGTLWRFAPEEKRKAVLLGEWPWLVKGFMLPILLWMLLNIGISEHLQPFMPKIQAAQNAGRSWFPAFFRVMSAGVFVVSSFWAAVSMACVLLKTWRGLEGEMRGDFRMLCVTSAVGMGLPALAIFWLAGWPATGLCAVAIMLPIMGYGPTIVHKVVLPPMYSRAIAKIKFGKYADAEQEIIKQLEGCETDYDGWLMLATLYAEQFKDLAGAEEIIMEICDQPRVKPPQLSVALHKLADWYLKIGGDPDAAGRALGVIINRLPGSHLARMAAARRANLPRSKEELHEQQIAHTVPMPSLNDELEETGDLPPLDESARAEASNRAKQLSTLLTENPNDVGAREKLARILATQLGRADLGISQIELLLGVEGVSSNKRAEWLSLQAAWKLKYQNNAAAAREIMEQIIREHPETPQAFAARRRLSLMDVESRPKPPPPKIIIRRD